MLLYVTGMIEFVAVAQHGGMCRPWTFAEVFRRPDRELWFDSVLCAARYKTSSNIRCAFHVHTHFSMPNTFVNSGFMIGKKRSGNDALTLKTTQRKLASSSWLVGYSAPKQST